MNNIKNVKFNIIENEPKKRLRKHVIIRKKKGKKIYIYSIDKTKPPKVLDTYVIERKIEYVNEGEKLDLGKYLSENKEKDLNNMEEVEEIVPKKKNKLSIIDDEYYDKLKKKPRKKRDSKYVNFLKLKRKKEKKSSSDINKVTDELIRKDISDVNDILAYLSNNKRQKIDRSVGRLYSVLVKSKIENTGNLKLTDVLTNKPLYMFFCRYDIAAKAISNDFLFLRSFFDRTSKDDLDIKNNIGKLVLGMYQSLSIDSVTFASAPQEYNGEFIKGYYQDFMVDYAFIGLEEMDEKIRKKILSKEYNNYEFILNGKEYICAGDEDGCAIFPKNAEPNMIEQKYNDMDKIRSEKGFQKGIVPKELDKEIRYIESKVKPESFCPAFLILPERTPFTIFYKMKIDYNYMFKFMDEYLVETKGDVYFPINFFCWENYPQCFDFLNVFLITSIQLKQYEDTLKKIKKIVDKYREVKYVLDTWKTCQLEFQKIINDFYHSFSRKIDYDKLDKIRRRLRYYVSERADLMEDNSYKDLTDFLSLCKNFSGMIVEQLSPKVGTFAEKMLDFLDDLYNNKNTTELLKRLKALGKTIYSMCYGDYDIKPIFPIALSPGAFLGAIDQIKEGDVLGEFVVEFKDKIEKKEKKEEEEANELFDFNDQLPKYIDKVAQLTAVEYIRKGDTENVLINDDYDNVIEDVKKMFKNKTYKEEIALAIKEASKAYKNKDYDIKPIESDRIKSVVNAAILDAKNNNLDKEKKKIDKMKIVNAVIAEVGDDSKEAKALEKKIEELRGDLSQTTIDRIDLAIKNYSRHLDKAKQDNNEEEINRITEVYDNFLDKAKYWYTVVVAGSGKYPKIKDENVLETTYTDLKKKYPIDNKIADIIAQKKNLQGPYALMNSKKLTEDQISKAVNSKDVVDYDAYVNAPELVKTDFGKAIKARNKSDERWRKKVEEANVDPELLSLQLRSQTQKSTTVYEKKTGKGGKKKEEKRSQSRGETKKKMKVIKDEDDEDEKEN